MVTLFLFLISQSETEFPPEQILPLCGWKMTNRVEAQLRIQNATTIVETMSSKAKLLHCEKAGKKNRYLTEIDLGTAGTNPQHSTRYLYIYEKSGKNLYEVARLNLYENGQLRKYKLDKKGKSSFLVIDDNATIDVDSFNSPELK